MTLNENDQAILLLTAQFSGSASDSAKPLTPTEYGSFSSWLREEGFKPADLFHRFNEIAAAWRDPRAKLSAERLKGLLNRGGSMALALEKWSNAGIWVLTRASNDYPKRFKAAFKTACPPVLFGVGNHHLLGSGGVAAVGSRSIDQNDERFANAVGVAAAAEGMTLISGGAKGVDTTAMLAALEVEGTAVGVLANDLFRAATSGRWRPHIRSKNLCLISAVSPEARFHVGTAMARNKYIYVLADYSVVVRSDENKGGTWEGAVEALKKGFAPVFVRADSRAAGNLALLRLGAQPITAPKDQAEGWLTAAFEVKATQEVQEEPPPSEESPAPLAEQSDSVATTAENDACGRAEGSSASESTVDHQGVDAFYKLFCAQVRRVLEQDAPMSQKALKEAFPDLVPSQFKNWLDRALSDGSLERAPRGKALQLPGGTDKQQSLL